MHNALSNPVVHRDVISFSILINSSFHAILSNVSKSVSTTPGKNDQRWPVYGTPGYIDPEYIKTYEVKDECDVYNFGVLMLELSTMREPIEMARWGKDLVIELFSELEINGGIKEIRDKSILEEVKMGGIQRFAGLAVRCVAKKGEERPTMVDVVEGLQDQDDNGCGSN